MKKESGDSSTKISVVNSGNPSITQTPTISLKSNVRSIFAVVPPFTIIVTPNISARASDDESTIFSRTLMYDRIALQISL